MKKEKDFGYVPVWQITVRNYAKMHQMRRNVVRHDSSERHQRCLDAKKVRVAPEKAPLTTAVMRLTCQQNDTMLKLFRTAYCLVKQNFSLRSFQSLLSLQECSGLQLGKAYRNRTAACMFIDSIATIIKKKVINDIKAGEFFSLLIDGSTDVSVKEQEIVHVKILKDGKAVTHFWGLIMQESGNADGILAGLESFFLQLGIQNWKSKLVRLSDCESHESESFTDDNSEYDSELIHSEISDHDEYDN